MLVLVNFIYGANFAIAKAVMPRYIPAFAFILMRVGFALVLYSAIYFALIREKMDKRDLPRFLFCGITGIALNQLLFFKGISLTGSINGALIMICTPLITYLIAHRLLGEKILPLKLFGIFLGMAGAAVLILHSLQAHSVQNNPLGDLLVLLNAVCYALYLIAVKPLMQKYNPITVIFMCFLCGFPLDFLAGISGFQSIDWQAIPTHFYWNIFFVLFFATFVVYLLNIWAMKSVSPTVVSGFIYLQPLFAIFISRTFTEERLSIVHFLGGIMIIIGLQIVNRPEKKVLEP